ncbi:hypothetical protein [Alkalicoccus luteus]|uniref:Uncharacterized protein n=1 Tax=Alkalicoccus luteus TaxID=1237094 RepID=A0A969PUM4_9BACI|nr:hypothetical protein [Alkalicoccus luteus]NJP36002.1 hypothetical protein [Alkalicoccus luteus]
MPDLQAHYLRTARTFQKIGTACMIAALSLAGYWTLSGWPVELEPLVLFITLALAGQGHFIAAAVKKRRAAQILTTVPEVPPALDQERRIMLVPAVHWLQNMHYITMDGEGAAIVREQADGFKKITTAALHLLGLRPYLQKRILVENQQGVMYRLEKKRGLRQYTYLYDQHGTKLGSYKMNVWNVTRRYTTFYNAEGEPIGESDGGFSGTQFKVKNGAGVVLIDVRHDGIPAEALHLFAGTRGDILQFHEDPAELHPVHLLAPALIQLHYRS